MIFWTAVILISWVAIDLFYPFKRDISRIDAVETAKMDAAMWKSYYEKRPVKLFFQSARLMRSQFHFPLWQSFPVAYYAAKAAFAFKDGKNRDDYQEALLPLKKYYGLVNRISLNTFDADSAAVTELEWWIIRRDREHHPPAEWEVWIAATPSIMYHIPATSFNEYAQLRVKAMLLRDAKGEFITPADWDSIRNVLLQSWQSFARQLHPGG